MRSRRLFWSVVDQIESMIDREAYRVGDRLPPERELAEAYNVSRPTIREAMIALEVRGRIEVRTSSGIYVLPHQHTQQTHYAISAFELTQARALIEGEAAALAATTITDEQLKQLQNALTDLKRDGKGKSPDETFHIILAQATKNRAVIVTIEKLWQLHADNPEVIEAYRTAWHTDVSTGIAEYTAIYNALKNRDARAARNAIHQHLNRLLDVLLRMSESCAVEEIKKKTNRARDLYSFEHLINQ